MVNFVGSGELTFPEMPSLVPNLHVTITPNFLESGEASSLDLVIVIESPNVLKDEVLLALKLREGAVRRSIHLSCVTRVDW